MEFHFTILLCLVSFVVSENCEECINFIQISAQLFASNEVVLLTEDFLKNEVCQTQFEDVTGCQKGVEKWYKPMTEAGLKSDDFGQRFCYHYGVCRPFEVIFGLIFGFSK